jgi:peptide/nickel transport system substrate-binding protein
MLPKSLLTAVILSMLLLAGCAPNTSAPSVSPPQAANRIVYGLTLEPSGFDPHVHRSSELGIPLRQVYDTLVYRDPRTQQFVPGLATEWMISEDGLNYTFKLRPDVTFHDGTPFNAQAVAANLDRITSEAVASQYAGLLLGPYENYEILDSYTIRLNLKETFSPLLDSLSQVYLGIASPAALAEYSVNRYQFHQVGTGPFTFVEYVPGDRLVIRRNPDYAWGPSFYTLPVADAVDEIEFRFFTDPPTRSLALEGEAAQAMGELLPSDARALTTNSAIQLLPTPIPGQPLQFLMNTQRFPTDNRAVRQALLFGTNRDAIIDAVYQRFSPVAWGPLAASTRYYSRDVIGLYSYDIGQARSLLDSLGYQDTNNDGILELGGVDLVVDVLVPPWGLIPEVAQLLQDQWATVGIRARLEPVPTLGALMERVASGEYNLAAFNSFGADPSFLNPYFLSDGSNNWTGFGSIELDNILHEAVNQTDDTVRATLYAQAQRLIMKEALILPIRDYVNLNGTSSALQGLTFDAYGWFPLLVNTSFAGQG